MRIKKEIEMLMKIKLLLIIITQDAYIGQRFTKRSSYLCGIYDKTANTMKEPFQIPTSEDIENLIGTDLYDVWHRENEQKEEGNINSILTH